MIGETFDRETMLDLLVNIIPLFILAFFTVGFAVVSPFGVDPLTSSLQFGLIAIPFVLLAVLTYFAGRAVAGSEKSGPVYLPGQASVRGAEPLEDPTDEGHAADPGLDGGGSASSIGGDDGAEPGIGTGVDANPDGSSEPDGADDASGPA